jgi:serine/threonine-protein kinase
MRVFMAPPPDAQVGSVLPGGYRVAQLLRSGGTAHLYAAERTSKEAISGKGVSAGRVAVKILRPELVDRAEMRARFDREVIAASAIEHPGVLRMIDAGRLGEGDLPYLVMELLVGLDLADTISFSGALRPARAARIADGIAAALSAAHEAGVVHRDVRPENVFLVHAADGREIVKLLDFGLAWIAPETARRLGAPGALPHPGVGAPEYTAPEEVLAFSSREPTSPSPSPSPPLSSAPAADIYSLGVVLHEMLTGQPPPPTRRAIEPLPFGLEQVIERALAGDPRARFASIADLRAELAAAVGWPSAPGQGGQPG